VGAGLVQSLKNLAVPKFDPYGEVIIAHRPGMKPWAIFR